MSAQRIIQLTIVVVGAGLIFWLYAREQESRTRYAGGVSHSVQQNSEGYQPRMKHDQRSASAIAVRRSATDDKKKTIEERKTVLASPAPTSERIDNFSELQVFSVEPFARNKFANIWAEPTLSSAVVARLRRGTKVAGIARIRVSTTEAAWIKLINGPGFHVGYIGEPLLVAESSRSHPSTIPHPNWTGPAVGSPIDESSAKINSLRGALARSDDVERKARLIADEVSLLLSRNADVIHLAQLAEFEGARPRQQGAADDPHYGTTKGIALSGHTQTYSGELRGGVPFGNGVMTWSSGDTYTGHFEDGVFSGFGMYRWNDGHTYQGLWNKGRMSSIGLTTFSGGDSYKGEVDFASASSYPSGFGVWFFGPPGNTYKLFGEFRAGRLDGYGTLYSPAGKTKAGHWYDDGKHFLLDGYGRSTDTSGHVLEGLFAKDVLQKPAFGSR